MIQIENNFKDKFRFVANNLVNIISSYWSFLFFLSAIFFWFAFGFWSGFTDHWQSILHIGLSIVTFLMVLLIQHVQHRETRSMQIKLDELINGVEGARNAYINLQDKPDDHMDKLHSEIKKTTAEAPEHEDDVKLDDKLLSEEPVKIKSYRMSQ